MGIPWHKQLLSRATARVRVRLVQIAAAIPFRLPSPVVMVVLLALAGAFVLGRFTGHRGAQDVDGSEADEEAAVVTTQAAGPASGAAKVVQGPRRYQPPARPPATPAPTAKADESVSVAVGVATAPALPDGCEGGNPAAGYREELLPSERYEGMRVTFRNRLQRPVHLVVRVPNSVEVSSRAVLLPGESLLVPLVSDALQADVVLGTQWCSRERGWVDPKVTRIRPAVLSAPGAVGMAVLLQSAGTSEVSLKIEHVKPKRLKLQPPSSVAVLPEGQPTIAVAPSAAVAPIPGHTPNFKDSVREADARMARAPNASRAPRGTSALSFLEGPLPSMDYEDLPSRAIRVVKNGAYHYLYGEIGADKETQFVVDLRTASMSALPASFQQELGIESCSRGFWWIQGSYRPACAAKIAELNLSGLELHDVWMAFTPAVTRPVIGRNVLGRATIKRGPDGDYLNIGGH